MIIDMVCMYSNNSINSVLSYENNINVYNMDYSTLYMALDLSFDFTQVSNLNLKLSMCVESNPSFLW